MNNQNNRDFKGVWIPKEIWLNKELSITEKCLLVEIDSLDHGEGCYASNEYLAEFLGTSPGAVAKIISGLRKKGFIIDRKFDGRKRWISIKSKQPLQKVNPDITKSKHSNTYNNTYNNTLSKEGSVKTFENSDQVLNNPIFEQERSSGFADLPPDVIRDEIERYLNQYPTAKFLSITNYLRDRNYRYKVQKQIDEKISKPKQNLNNNQKPNTEEFDYDLETLWNA